MSGYHSTLVSKAVVMLQFLSSGALHASLSIHGLLGLYSSCSYLHHMDQPQNAKAQRSSARYLHAWRAVLETLQISGSLAA